MQQSAERVVVITGGGTGIGKAIAGAFAQQDAYVIILGRRAAVVQRAATALGTRVTWRQTDVSRREQVEDTIRAIVTQFGRIDVLVNAAGFVHGVDIQMSLAEAEERWDDVIATNLTGSFLMALAVAPHMAHPGGRIINISSIAAYTGGSTGGATAYAAAKAGVHGLTVGLARDLGPLGITVNAIAPGFIAQTEFTGHWSQERIQGIVAQTPMGREGHAEDIAAAALYLASPTASFVTGQILSVNGGWLFGR